MTEKDKRLISKAKKSYWTEIDESLADSEEARKILHNIAVSGFHREEALAGII